MTRNAASCLLAIAALACAPAVLAKSSDRNQTMDVKADSSDCTVTETGPCILTGNVRLAQGTLNIQAARADIRRAGGEPVSVRLTGSPAQLSQDMDNGGTMNATAAQVDYDLQQDTWCSPAARWSSSRARATWPASGSSTTCAPAR